MGACFSTEKAPVGAAAATLVPPAACGCTAPNAGGAGGSESKAAASNERDSGQGSTTANGCIVVAAQPAHDTPATGPEREAAAQRPGAAAEGAAAPAAVPSPAAPAASSGACGTVALAAEANPGIFLTVNEEERLRAVRALNLIGARDDPRFHAITSLMQQMFQTPVAAVTLIEEQDLHFMSRQGDWACSAGRAGSFCDWVLVEQAHEMLVVEDASKDERFKGNKYVSGEPFIRFYAGSPLVSTIDGHRYGTLCVFDFKPRAFTSSQYAMLAHFSEIAVREMERDLAMQWQQQEFMRAEAARLHLTRAMDAFHEGIILLDFSSGTSWRMVYANDAFRAAAGMPHLLLGSTPQDGNDNAASSSASAVEGGGGDSTVATSPDFWELFGHVTSGHTRSYNAALSALVAGKEFTIKVRTNSSADGGGGSSAAASSQQVLTIRFKPADGEELRAGMPHIGVPSFAGSSADEAEGIIPLPTFTQPSPQPSLPDSLSSYGSGGGGGGGAMMGRTGSGSSGSALQRWHSMQQRRQAGGLKPQPLYYFGIVQQDSRSATPLPGQLAPSSSQQQLQQAASLAMAATRQKSADSCKGDSDSSLMRRTSTGGSEQFNVASLPMSGVIPSFYQVRPDVMQEVKLGTLIGTGSMGRCYRGIWQGGRVAVKIIECWGDEPSRADGGTVSEPAAADPHGLPRPAQPHNSRAAAVEAMLARCLSHPHIITTFCHGVASGDGASSAGTAGTAGAAGRDGSSYQQVWIVQEYCNKGTLMSAIDRGLLKARSGRPHLPAILVTAQEIAGALSYLHSHGVIHGDLTPSNVLLQASTKDARRWACKVADFGLSTHSPGMSELRSSSFGTITHMPPELMANGVLSRATDVFSFGVMLMEMYAGRRAWFGENPTTILARVVAGGLPFEIPAGAPPALASLMRRCTDLDPAQRPSFAEILDDVMAIIQSLPGGASSVQLPSAHRAQRSVLTQQQQGSSPSSKGQLLGGAGAGNSAAAPAVADNPAAPATESGAASAGGGEPSGFSPTASLASPFAAAARDLPPLSSSGAASPSPFGFPAAQAGTGRQSMDVVSPFAAYTAHDAAERA